MSLQLLPSVVSQGCCPTMTMFWPTISLIHFWRPFAFRRRVRWRIGFFAKLPADEKSDQSRNNKPFKRHNDIVYVKSCLSSVSGATSHLAAKYMIAHDMHTMMDDGVRLMTSLP